MKKLIRYAIPVSRRFPSTHNSKGEPTYFVEAIQKALGMLVQMPDFLLIDIDPKLHTIRNNKNNVWTKRMKKVQEGKAVIDLFYWELPGGRWTKDNQQIVFATLDKDSGCGMQEIVFLNNDITQANIQNTELDEFECEDYEYIAQNDGLSVKEFKSWFKGYDLSKPLAIIQFTKFRY